MKVIDRINIQDIPESFRNYLNDKYGNYTTADRSFRESDERTFDIRAHIYDCNISNKGFWLLVIGDLDVETLLYKSNDLEKLKKFAKAEAERLAWECV
ncbi:hypothetical protein EZS27_004095 [termite gut metagenome]|uniref:Uncharacterized protein n=1 Tax=termite gut metagenome TaxID=433724 RepID=A0A5J4STM2_9ZZZZ